MSPFDTEQTSVGNNRNAAAPQALWHLRSVLAIRHLQSITQIFFVYWRRQVHPQQTLWTDSIELNWSWKTNTCSTNKKVANFHRTGKFISGPQETVTGSYNEPHTTCSHPETYLFKIAINIILPPTPRLPFPRKNFACISNLHHMYYMPRPSYPSWFRHPKNTELWVRGIILIIIPNITSIFRCLAGSEGSSQVRGPVWHFACNRFSA